MIFEWSAFVGPTSARYDSMKITARLDRDVIAHFKERAPMG
jgi:hypothetical protein